jgi:transitional endoplasmic reticulum ATPase
MAADPEGGSTTPTTGARAPARYLLVAAALALAYLVVVPVLWQQRGVVEDGPLSFRAPALTTALVPGQSPERLEQACARQEPFSSLDYQRMKVVGGRVAGRVYYGCYAVATDGAVRGAAVLDQDLLLVRDVALLKRSGAWRWIGGVKTELEAALGFAGLVGILGMYLLYYRRPRPGPRARAGRQWWQGPGADIAFGLLLCLGWLLIWVLPGRSLPRKVRVSFMYGFAYVPLFLLGAFSPVLDCPDALSAVVVGMLGLAVLWGWLGGRALLRGPGWGYPDPLPEARPPAAQPLGQPVPVPLPAGPSPAPPGPAPASPPAWPPPQNPGRSTVPPGPAPAGPGPAAHPGLFKVQRPDQLPTFADVGGMTPLKDLLADTLGLLLAFGEQADRYRINFNGILLHGPPGVGKTFVARATAGEFGLNFVPVVTGDLISRWLGESAKNVAAAFRFAATNVPCVLFFDEFDSVALRRDDEPDNESRRVVNQLLSSLEEYRAIRELIVMAATNRLEQLDPAVVRPGRFDKHARVDLPDRQARLAVLAAQLRGRPVAEDLDLDSVVERTEGLTPAVLAAIVEEAALAAFRESTTTSRPTPITTAGLLGALLARGGADRPTPGIHRWDDLVLDPRAKQELQQVQRLIEDPELARNFGIDPPSGLLLGGPPGTGKTTIARVLAAEARCSFYSVSAADLTSKWVGESERRVQTLFDRARDNAPSIVFLDELDAIAGRRGAGQDFADRLLTQLLTEIDGLGSRPGVFVVGATNRLDVLDPAIRRGGRLSRTILVPLPDLDARVAILRLQTRRMPLGGVDLAAVARVTEGFSGGDLKAVCQQAAVNALMRTSGGRADDEAAAEAEVRLEDFAAAVAAIQASKKTTPPHPPGGR